MNIGMDMAIFKNRISGSFEYYQRIISDLLYFKPINTYHDLNHVWSNIGKTQSRGFEATINTKNIIRSSFTWSTDFTFSMYRDRWLERADDWKPNVYEDEEDPIHSRYLRVAAGILQAGEPAPVAQPDLKAGQIIIKDINGYQRDEYGDPLVENGKFMRTGAPDGIIDDADTKLMGTTDPGYIAGLSNLFTYKAFDLRIDLNGLFDRQMQDPTHMAYGVSADGIAQYGYNGLRTLNTRWTPDNPSTTQPSSFFGWSRYGYGDWFYEDAWFIRLQNIALGYTLVRPQKKVFSSLRIYFDANNLFVFTPYKGLDPETDAYARSLSKCKDLYIRTRYQILIPQVKTKKMKTLIINTGILIILSLFYGCADLDLLTIRLLILPYSRKPKLIFNPWFYPVTTRLEEAGGMALIRILKEARCL